MLRKRILSLFAVLFALVWAPAGAATSVDQRDSEMIRDVINAQLKAFRDDDDERAFGLATRAIRRQFGDSASFMRMVKAAFQPLYRSLGTEFMDPRTYDEGVLQPIKVFDEAGGVFLALYRMSKESDGQWRIAGCQLVRSELIFV